MPGAGLEPARPLGGHLILSRPCRSRPVSVGLRNPHGYASSAPTPEFGVSRPLCLSGCPRSRPCTLRRRLKRSFRGTSHCSITRDLYSGRELILRAGAGVGTDSIARTMRARPSAARRLTSSTASSVVASEEVEARLVVRQERRADIADRGALARERIGCRARTAAAGLRFARP